MTAASPVTIRDRVRELRRVQARALKPNPRNWRTHPREQRDALRAVLADVGMADALLARELPGGELELVDGHLRAETLPDQLVPVLILDVTQEEADKLLLTIDPLAAMAGADRDALKALIGSAKFSDEATANLIRETARDAGVYLDAANVPLPAEAAGRAIDESAADDVEFHACPNCGHRWPK